MGNREIRNTRQKTAIREAFAGANGPLSPEEVLRSAQRHHPGVGIATVYRNIQTLVEEGWLQPVEVPGDATRYEVAGKNIIITFIATNVGNCMTSKDVLHRAGQNCPGVFVHPDTNFTFTAHVRHVSPPSRNAASKILGFNHQVRALKLSAMVRSDGP